MQSFKKDIKGILLSLLVLCLVSVALISPFLNSNYKEYQDANYRDELQGKIDCLIFGTSHCNNGIIPKIIDERLDCVSYNMANNMMTWDSKIYLLKKEIARNPIKHVIIDISFNTLFREENKEDAYGYEYEVARLNNSKERADCLLDHIEYNDLLNLYAREVLNGVDYWHSYFNGEQLTADFSNKGFHPLSTNPIYPDDLLNEAEKANINIGNVNKTYEKENVEKFQEFIDICKDNSIEVIITAMPISNYAIKYFGGLDSFHNWILNFANKNNCKVYDFNLVKNRNQIISDECSFFDILHLSENGANAVTNELCDVIMKSQNENVENLFYSSYEEMMANL